MLDLEPILEESTVEDACSRGTILEGGSKDGMEKDAFFLFNKIMDFGLWCWRILELTSI